MRFTPFGAAFLLAVVAFALTGACCELEDIKLDAQSGENDPSQEPSPPGAAMPGDPEAEGPFASSEWVSGFGGLLTDGVDGLVKLSDGALLVTGHFERDALFARGQLEETRLTANGSDSYLAVYDRQGKLEWARALGLPFPSRDLVVAALPDEAIVVSGTIEGPGHIETFTGDFVPVGGHSDVFVSTYSSGGTLLWTRIIGGDGNDVGAALGVIDDRIFVAARFEQMATVKIDGEPVLESGNEDAAAILLVLQVDSEPVEARIIAGSSCHPGGVIVPLGEGGYLLSGTFAGTAALGSGKDGLVQLVNSYDEDDGESGFLAAYHQDGSLRWASTLSSRGGDIELTTASSGKDIAVAGTFMQEVAFNSSSTGPGLVLYSTKEPNPDPQPFLPSSFNAVYSWSGEISWVGSPGEPGCSGTTASSVAFQPDGQVLTAGFLEGKAVFGEACAQETTLDPAEDETPYILRRGLDGSPTGAWRFAKALIQMGDSRIWAVPLDDGAVAVAGTFVGLPMFRTLDDEFTMLGSVGSTDGFLATISP